MCMDLYVHSCSFLDSKSHVITNRAMKRLVFLVEHSSIILSKMHSNEAIVFFL